MVIWGLAKMRSVFPNGIKADQRLLSKTLLANDGMLQPFKDEGKYFALPVVTNGVCKAHPLYTLLLSNQQTV